MRPVIIGITGKRKVGKSTIAAQHLIDKHGFVRVGFSDPIKAMMRALGIPEEYVTGARKEEACPYLLGQTSRWAQQSLGTEWGRKCIHPHVWCAFWSERASDVLDHNSSVVADDIREEVEADYVRNLGGIVVRIERPDRPVDEQLDSHSTEQLDWPADLTLVNDGPAEKLQSQLDTLVAIRRGEL
jgi:hypothetical protein